MLTRLTKALARLLPAAALLCTLSGAGVAAPRGDAPECPMMSRAHDCCKKARPSRDARVVAPAPLCCVVNLPQPAPTGTGYTVRSSPGASSDPRPPAAPPAPAPAAEHARRYAPPFHPSHSPPAYIQQAAFLI